MDSFSPHHHLQPCPDSTRMLYSEPRLGSGSDASKFPGPPSCLIVTSPASSQPPSRIVASTTRFPRTATPACDTGSLRRARRRWPRGAGRGPLCRGSRAGRAVKWAFAAGMDAVGIRNTFSLFATTFPGKRRDLAAHHLRWPATSSSTTCTHRRPSPPTRDPASTVSRLLQTWNYSCQGRCSHVP